MMNSKLLKATAQQWLRYWTDELLDASIMLSKDSDSHWNKDWNNALLEVQRLSHARGTEMVPCYYCHCYMGHSSAGWCHGCGGHYLGA